MKFLKANLNKLLLIIIYIVMFYGVSNLLAILLRDYAINNNKQVLSSTIINLTVYAVMFTSCAVLLKKEIKTDFKKLKKTNSMTIFLICLIGIICAYSSNIFGSLITMVFGGGNTSQNQAGIELLLFSEYGILIAIMVMFIGPIVEELVFRKSMHDILRNAKCPTWLMLIISSILFGLIHVIDSGDFVQVFPYIFMGATLGGIEIYSKNIYPSIFVHILLNSFSTVMLLFLHILEQGGIVI